MKLPFWYRLGSALSRKNYPTLASRHEAADKFQRSPLYIAFGPQTDTPRYFSMETKPRKLKLPSHYDPYGPRPPPSDKILKLAEAIASLSPEERKQIGPCLRDKLRAPRIEMLSAEAAAAIPQVGPASGAAKAEEKKAEKTAFDIKLEKFDSAAKIKVIKEVRAFTDLGLKEAKELVEKAPVILKQGVTKEEANAIIEKIKAAGGVAVME